MATAHLICPTCSTAFERQHGRQRYCAAECRQVQHKKYPTPCTRCGTIAMKYPTNRYKQFCGTRCRDAHLSETASARAKARPSKPPVDPRGPLRRALEDGTPTEVLDIIRAKCIVTDTGCWQWQGRFSDGYATARVGKRDMGVHRLSLEASLGQPLGDQPAHHMCANSMCVNPEHLQPVTHRENTAEMLARTYMERRILALEAALRATHPEHHLLGEVGLPPTVRT